MLFLLEYGSCEGKLEKMLDVLEIKTIFGLKVGTSNILYLEMQRMYTCA